MNLITQTLSNCVIFALVVNVTRCSVSNTEFSFIPTHYDIEIRPILDSGEEVGDINSAPGTVKIIGSTPNKTDKINLYIKGLLIKLSSITVDSLNNPVSEQSTLNIVSISKINNDEDLEILLSRETVEGEEIQVFMKYVVNIGEWGDGGLVYSKLKPRESNESLVVGTRFEKEWPDSYSRYLRAFPCVEIVNMKNKALLKATFNLTVFRRNFRSTLANTDIISSTPDPNHTGWVLDQYSKTKRITPDILSFVVLSNYSSITVESNSKGVNVHGPTDLVDIRNGYFAAEFGIKVMNFLDEYLNTSWSTNGKKAMDFVIVPDVWVPLDLCGISYFSMKSVSPGTILMDETNSTKSKSITATNIASSLAMNYAYQAGTQNCLSRGIELYLEQLALKQFSDVSEIISHQEYLSTSFYTTNENVLRPYKSWALTRMVEGILGPRRFHKFLQTYIQSGVNDQMLLEILQEFDADISDTLPSWCNKPGFPLVKVEVFNKSHVVLSQEPFKHDHTGDRAQNVTWKIPITIQREEDDVLSESIYWLKDKTELLVEHNISKWILLNPNVTGYYRVLYDKELYQKINDQLMNNSTVFSTLTRAQLLADSFVFAKHGLTSIQTALNFTRYLEQEKEIVVWETVFALLYSIRLKLSTHSTGYPDFVAYIHKRLDTLVRSLGLKNVSNDVLFWVCGVGKPSPYCGEQAKLLLTEWKTNPENIISSMSKTPMSMMMSCAAAAEGGREAFELLYPKYEVLPAEEYKRGFVRRAYTALQVITCTRDPEIVTELFNKTLDINSATNRDAMYVWERLLKNPVGRSQFLPFLRSNLDRVFNMFVSERNTEWENFLAKMRGEAIIERSLKDLSEIYGLEEQIVEIETFLRDNKDEISLGRRDNIIRENVEWMNTTGMQILDWLADQA